MNFSGKTEVTTLFIFKRIWESVSSLYDVDVQVLETSLYPPLKAQQLKITEKFLKKTGRIMKSFTKKTF